MDDAQRRKLLDGVIRKAVGFETVETQEEYSLIDGDLTLTKRKVTTKEVPPDITALRFLLGENETQPVTREELERERERLTAEFYNVLAQKNAGLEARKPRKNRSKKQ